MTMLQWETVHGRDRAVSGKREYRVFYGPKEASQALPWTLVVREVGEDGEPYARPLPPLPYRRRSEESR